MKDNKENLNGALDDDALEEVAGGKWKDYEKKGLKRALGLDDAGVEELMKTYSNPKKLIDAMPGMGYSQDEINVLKREISR